MCDFYGGELADLWVHRYPKARKEHRCEACGGTIKPGRRYLSLFTLFDGSGSTVKCCLPCERIGRKFAEVHRMTPHPSALVDSLQECIEEEPLSAGKWRPMLRAIRNRAEASA